MIETFFCDSKNDYDIAIKSGYGEVTKLIAEGVLNKSIESDNGNNETKPQAYDNAIIYTGDRDKAVAIIMKEYLPNSTIVDIADYKSYMCRNAYAIGGWASKGLEKFPDNVTEFVGNDFKETYELMVKYLKKINLM